VPEFYRLEIPLGVSYVDINAVSASQTLVNGTAGKRIVVLSVSLVANNVGTATFQTSTGSIGIAGPYYCAQYGGIVLPFNAGGWFETAIGDSLALALGSGINAGGCLSYTYA
jgi:hypothetical protein